MHLGAILSYVNYICDYDSMKAHLLFFMWIYFMSQNISINFK